MVRGDCPCRHKQSGGDRLLHDSPNSDSAVENPLTARRILRVIAMPSTSVTGLLFIDFPTKVQYFCEVAILLPALVSACVGCRNPGCPMLLPAACAIQYRTTQNVLHVDSVFA